jgi:hypothetical protein
VRAESRLDPIVELIFEEGRQLGRILGRRESVFDILRWRGIEVPAFARTRIEWCGCLDLLTLWAERAVHANTFRDLFTATD